MLKVDFLICGRRGFNVLQHYIKRHGAAAINAVCSYADKNVLNDPYGELTSYCKEKSIVLHQRKDYQPTENIYRFVIGWQYLLPAGEKTIVLHDSLLPKYRGFSPLISSLINGEHELGVTAFIATEGYDEGPVAGQEKIAVDYPLTILQAMELVTPLYCSLCDSLTAQIGSGSLRPAAQDDYLATYSLWRDEADYSLNWNNNAEQIKRTIDALGYPYSGALCFVNNEKISVKSAEIFGDLTIENRVAGKVIFIKNECPVVVCNEGLLKITSAFYCTNGSSIIPFKKLKSRFS